MAILLLQVNLLFYFFFFLPLPINLCYTSAAAAAAAAQSLPEASTDHVALLAFKSLLSDPTKALSSWNSTSSHHCHWYGVSCNTTNGNQERVTSLELEALSLSGPISPALSNLTFLQKLHLPNNTFHGPIPADLGHLRGLVNLNLSINHLDGEIPASLGGCANLQGLSMRNNELQGTIPVNITTLSNLQVLSLRNNHLHGGIPPELGGLPRLQSIFFQSNNLTGAIPPSLSNLTSLKELRLAENNLDGAIPPDLHRITGLQILSLYSNHLSGEVPPTIYNFSDVHAFLLNRNLLRGRLPQHIGTSLPKLTRLSLDQNQFEGPIPPSISNSSKLNYLSLDENSFSGVVPPTLGLIPTLSVLNLGSNRLVATNTHDWRFIDSLTNCSKLQQIDLIDNLFGASFPLSVANLSNSMTFLRMSFNAISGEIPKEIARNLKNLQYLFLDNNLLTGPIPDTIGQLTNLGVLSLFNNSLSGEIPESIGNITTLTNLYLFQNRLTGSIPPSFQRLHSLNAMGLSHNKLTGEIPTGLLKISTLSNFLNLSGNSLTGNLPVEVGSLRNLVKLDVSDNNLTGEIPSSIGKCLLLVSLHLGGNSFQGRIPRSLANLKGLQTLDLSGNNLSGRIPSFLAKLPDLTYLNLSFNHLEGKVPGVGVFGNASLVSLVGNEKLCGGVPALGLDPCNSGGGGDGGKRPLRIIIPVLSAAAVLFLAVLIVFCVRRRSRKPRKGNILGAPSASLGSRHSHVSYKELRKATGGFSSANLIGSGSYGSVYRGDLVRFKKVVAVKVLDCEQRGAVSGFAAECDVLRNIRHRNLLRVFTSCSTVDNNGDDFKALVYEYMPNGSLDSWLHGGGRPSFLGLRERVKIAEDVALALDYLHHQGHVPVIHSDLKPSNILLDDDMTAHVGDFGLARFLKKNPRLETGGTSTLAIKGTVGYIAPEYGMGSPISREGDVYSFGILLLEMLTGKRPIDEELGDGINLHIHARNNYPENVQDIIDTRLLERSSHRISEEEYECMSLMVGIGLACSREAPSERIDTKQVLQQFAVIKDILGATMK